MSVSAFIRRCIDAGMPIEMALMAGEQLEAGSPPAAENLTPRQLRNRRYYENKKRLEASESVLIASEKAETSEQDATPASPSSLPPRPPNLTTPTPPVVTTRTRQADAFEVFWEAYPRKTAKHVAEKAFPKAIASIDAPDPLAVMLAGIARDREGRQWRQGVIPHASTWLNQKRWQDEPETGNPDERHSNSPRQADRDQRLSRMLAGAMEAVDRT